jgi:hypothetical protein
VRDPRARGTLQWWGAGALRLPVYNAWSPALLN